MGGVKSDWQMGGDRVKNDLQGRGGGVKTDSPIKTEAKGEGTPKRHWQLEETIDSPSEVAVAVYRSSVPASARASLGSSPSKPAPITTTTPPNGSLLNGSHRATTTMPQDVDMRMVGGGIVANK